MLGSLSALYAAAGALLELHSSNWVQGCKVVSEDPGWLSFPLHGREIDELNDITKGFVELSCVDLAHPPCEDEQKKRKEK